MPKKQPRNSFYFFMIDFKEEQRKKGINYANMQEVATAAGPVWTSVAPKVRAKYEAIAKEEKQKQNVPEKKFTSTGISLAEVEREKQEKREAEQAECKDINNFVKLKSFNNSILDEEIYLMDVNFYCRAGAEYLIGESTLLRFSIREGLKDIYHEIINPGGIPVGYALEVKMGCEEFGLEMPDDSTRRTDLIKILANVIDYLKQKDRTMKVLPPIFTLPEKVAPVMDFIHQMCMPAGEDEGLFRVYRLDTLFFTLMNNIRTHNNEGFPKQSLALAQLKKDPFKYSPGLGCEHHEEIDKGVECSAARVKRWAFTVLDSCCPVAGVAVLPGQHLPHDYDVDGIIAFKEQHREVGGAAGVPGHPAGAAGRGRGMPWGAPPSADTSVSESLHDSSLADQFPPLEAPKKERKDIHVRMPKTDYSKRVIAPGFDDTPFETVVSGLGRGRRGMSSSFDSMNISK